jgi:membrane protease YdiL (CAAX protease family)
VCVDNPPIQLPLSGTEELLREEPSSPLRPDPDNPPWGLWGALALLLSSFVFMAVAQGALVFPYALRRGVPLTRDAVAEFISHDAGAIVLALVGLVVAHLLTLVPAWLIVTRAGRYPFLRTLGWEWGGRLTLWRSAGLAVLLLMVGMLILKLSGAPENEFDRILRSSRAAALVTAFAATFTAPLVEEILFRGLLYSALRRLVGAGWAVSLVFLLFAAIHVPQYWPSFGVLGTILLLSFVLTVIRAHTGRLLPCFVIHLIFNGIQSVFIVFGPYLERFFPDTPAPDPGLLVGLILRHFGIAW